MSVTNASAEIPATPTSLAYITNNLNYVNWSWISGAGNITNSYNVSVNSVWTNGSTAVFYNHTGLTYSSTSSISVYAYNTTGLGNLSIVAVSDSYSIPSTVQSDLANFISIATNFVTHINNLLAIFLKPPLLYFTFLGIFIALVGLIKRMMGGGGKK